MLGENSPQVADRAYVMGSAIGALRDSGAPDLASQEKVLLRAAAYAFAAAMASLEGSCSLEGEDQSANYWAARAVHLIARANFDQVDHLALHLKSQLRL